MIRALSGVLPSQTFEPDLHLGRLWLFGHHTVGTLRLENLSRLCAPVLRHWMPSNAHCASIGPLNIPAGYQPFRIYHHTRQQSLGGAMDCVSVKCGNSCHTSLTHLTGLAKPQIAPVVRKKQRVVVSASAAKGTFSVVLQRAIRLGVDSDRCHAIAEQLNKRRRQIDHRASVVG